MSLTYAPTGIPAAAFANSGIDSVAKGEITPRERIEAWLLYFVIFCDRMCCGLTRRFDFDAGGVFNFLEDVCWRNITTNATTASR